MCVYVCAGVHMNACKGGGIGMHVGVCDGETTSIIK